MTSSRPLRKTSRLSTPLDVSMKDASTSERETSEQKNTGGPAQGWSEPPLRNPAPSFEDYKGYERHGVLEHMAPLGSVPSQKVKLRVKNFEAPRRSLLVKNGESAVAKEGVKTPTEPTPSTVTRRSESRKVEDRPSRTLSSREKDDDKDYTPKAAPKVTTPKATPTNNTIHGTPSSRTSAGRVRLGQVVDSAVERSLELGNPQLGLAVKKLFEESLHNRTLADLLDAVLSQKPTPSQAADFQAYIKIARKQIKAEGGKESSARRSSVAGMGSPSKSSSKSPTKSVRPSVGGENGTSHDSSLATGAITISSTNPPQPQNKPLPNGKMSPSKGSSSREEPPPKRVKRSRSSSISSSLSSLSSIDEPMESEDANAAETHARTQPMTNLKAQLPHGPKLHTFSTTNLSHSSNKRPSVAAGPVNDDTAEEVAVKRRKLQKSFEDYAVVNSSVRVSPTPKQPGAAPPPISTAPPPAVSRAQPTRLRNGTTRKHEYEELQSPASSAPGDLLVPPPLGASRGATPNQLGRPSKLVRKAARVKMSPIKKKSGVIAGMPRVGGGRDSPVGYGHMDDTEDHENNDYCSACGGSGQLLCCDGCTRSFHFTCLDPPMDPNRPPEGEWFCYICQSRKNPQPRWAKTGVFEPLFTILNKKNPVAYNLPVEIREYFEGVKTGEEGEYEETTTLKSRSKSGYDEAPDYYKLKDSKGNVVTCYKCRKTALGHRPIIPCDFCNLQWHLDCVDPPLANPPYRANNNKPRTSWMCPNHIDRELSALNSTVKISPEDQPGDVKTRKVRRPKNARIVDTALRRGFKNNGLIEIQNDPSDEEDETEREEMGIVYRLPEKGVKLDFIDRVKMSNLTAPKPAREWLTVRTRDERTLHVAAQARAQTSVFHNRSLADQQAALNLAQFAQLHPDLNLSSDQVQNLITTLIAEAPTDVLAMSHHNDDDDDDDDGTALADTDTDTAAAAANKKKKMKKNASIPPSPPESDQQVDHAIAAVGEREKQTLRMFQELIRRRLEGGAGGGSVPTA